MIFYCFEPGNAFEVEETRLYIGFNYTGVLKCRGFREYISEELVISSEYQELCLWRV